jgi:threonine aldolase
MSYALIYIQARIKEKEKKDAEKVRKGYSKLLDDTYMITANGDISFNGGVYYKKEEVEQVKNLNKQGKKQVHLLKKAFSAKLI